MALVSLRQLLDHAAEHCDGVPAFNVNNMEQIQAILQAADARNSPAILAFGCAGRASRIRPLPLGAMAERHTPN
jgi:fructose-bisphosphate aldolase class II